MSDRRSAFAGAWAPWASDLLAGSGLEHSVVGEYTDNSVVHVGSQGTVAWPQGLAEPTSSGTNLDAADEHIVASHTDQP